MLRHKNKFTKVLSLMLALIFIVSAFSGCGGDKDNDEGTTKAPQNDVVENNEPVDTTIRNPLTGEAGYDEALLNNKPVVVVVENSPAARPQWGLTSSDMVFEMVAEGGISRMLLVYSDLSRLPAKIGPVRSARPYFVDITRGLGAAFIHFGGSIEAYNTLNSINISRMDGMANDGTYFKRDADRLAVTAREHTAYTTNELANDYFTKNNLDMNLDEKYTNLFSFNPEAQELSGGKCSEISFMFSGSYKYKYTYNKEDNLYYSQINGKDFADSDGNQQYFSNVIILYTDIYLDASQKAKYNEDRMFIEFDGGKGVYVSNGTYEDITWEKGAATDSFKFYGADGKELKLNIGKTYVGITDSDNASSTVIA